MLLRGVVDQYTREFVRHVIFVAETEQHAGYSIVIGSLNNAVSRLKKA